MIFSAKLRFGISIKIESESPLEPGAIDLEYEHNGAKMFEGRILSLLELCYTALGRRLLTDSCAPIDLLHALQNEIWSEWQPDLGPLREQIGDTSPGTSLILKS